MESLIGWNEMFIRTSESKNTMVRKILVFIGFAAVATSMGQNFSDVRSTVSGTGEFKLNNQEFRISESSVTLDSRGTASLFLKTDRRNFNLTGNWTRTSSLAARITIKGGSIRDARGTADIVLNSDWSLASTTFNGSGTEGSFVGSFRSGRGGGSNVPSPGSSLDQTKNGTGTLKQGRDNQRISRARVVLDRRGGFQITLHGRSTWQFSGSWKPSNDSGVRLVIANNSEQSNGSGTLHSDFRGGFSSLELNGKIKDQSFSIVFRADDDNNDWEFSDNARGEGLIDGPKDEDYKLQSARVRLYRNGTFEIVLQSNRSHTYYGRWRDSGNQIDLVLTNVSGAGNMVLGRRSIHRFAFTYMEGGKSYIVSFTAS